MLLKAKKNKQTNVGNDLTCKRDKSLSDEMFLYQYISPKLKYIKDLLRMIIE